MAVGKRVKQAIQIMMAIVLVIGLTACSVAGAPSRQLVEKAIALQLKLTQTELSQQLRLDTGEFQLERLTISEQTPVEIDELPGYKIRGTYNLKLKRSQRQVTQEKNPFEVYLQRQQEGKTWRLARLQKDEAGEKVWVTRSLLPPD